MSSTPYDDVFRTLLTDCTELMIPVVNEIFHTDYTGNEKIRLLQNEHFIQMPDGSTQAQLYFITIPVQSQVLRQKNPGATPGFFHFLEPAR